MANFKSNSKTKKNVCRFTRKRIKDYSTNNSEKKDYNFHTIISNKKIKQQTTKRNEELLLVR